MVESHRQVRGSICAFVRRTARIVALVVGFLVAERAAAHEDIDTEVKKLTTAGYREIKAGNFAYGIADFQRCLELKPKNASSAYDLACAYSMKRDLDPAAEWFQRAIEWGFDDVKHVEGDPDLDNFRSHPRYAAVLSQLRKKHPMGSQRDDTPGLTRLLDLIVMIRGKLDLAGTPTEAYGAGILFGCDGNRTYLVTANHVVRYGQDARDLKVLLKAKPGQWLEAKLMPHFDEALDLAVLSIEPLENHGLKFCGLPLECTAPAEALRRRDSVYPVGHPNAVLWGMPVAPDRIAQVVGHEIAFQSAFIARGHSGGALVTAKGALVGLLKAEEPPYGVAIGIEKVIDTLKAWNYPIQLRPVFVPAKTALHVAAEKGAMEEARRLLENCASPNAADASGWTPLHAAAKSGSARMAELLLKYGAEPYAWTFTEKLYGKRLDRRDWRTTLHIATTSGAADVVQVLLARGMNPDVEGLFHVETGLWRGHSPIEIAASLGHAEIISLLAKAGANVNTPGSNRQTPLYLAVEAGKLESVTALLKAGANPTPVDKRDRSETPLHLAISKGHVEIVRAMIAAKADVNARQDAKYPLPLTVAVDGKANEIVRLLAAAGARPDAGTVNEAIENDDADMLKFLLRSKPNLNAEAEFNKGRSNPPKTPLAVAIERGKQDFVKLLVDSGADVNRPGWFAHMPLFITMQLLEKDGAWARDADVDAEARTRLLAIEEYLISRKARLGKDDDLARLLWHAGRDGRVNAVKFLLDQGANPNFHPYVGTHLGNAIDSGEVEIVRTMLKAGAQLTSGRAGGVDAERLLQFGIEEKDPAIVKHALGGGAKVTARDIESAADSGNAEVAALVRNASSRKK